MNKHDNTPLSKQKNMVATPQKPPTCPVPLDKFAKKIYTQICKFLIENDAMANIDSLTIAMAAGSYHLFIKNFLIVNKETMFTDSEGEVYYKSGAIQEYSSGARAVSPEFTIMERERTAWIKFTALLGLTVHARERLISFSSEDGVEDDFFANIIKMKQKVA